MTAEGRFAAEHAEPLRYESVGTWQGDPRITRLSYEGRLPIIRQLVPLNDRERDPVPEAEQRNTTDTASAVAELVRRVNATGRCEGATRTFDGRRLAELEARTSGKQDLPPTGRSRFAGPTLRCEFTGRQTGGFIHGEDLDRLKQPQYSSAWFAPLTEAGPMVPVRIAFKTRWFGDATMYIVGSSP